MIANGVLVSKRERHGRATTHWRATEPMAPYLAFFAAGSFETRSVSCHGVPNYVAVSRHAPVYARGEATKRLAGQTCDIITALSGVLGPYPFSATGGLVTSLPVSVRAGEPDPADLSRRSQGPARSCWRTSWRTSGSATRSRSQLE